MNNTSIKTSNYQNPLTSQCLREMSQQILQKPSKQRSTSDICILQQATQNIKFFQEILADEGQTVLQKCLTKIRLEIYQESTIVFEKGDKGKDFYIILSGEIGIYIYSNNETQTQDFIKPQIRQSIKEEIDQLILTGVKPSQEHTLEVRKILLYEKINKLFKANHLIEGDSFGERALINETARLATVVCETECHLGVLSKQDYKDILQQAQGEKIQAQISELQQISAFSKLSRKLLTILFYAFQSQEFKYREYVYKQNDNNTNYLYLIQGGEFKITQETKVTTYDPFKINYQGIKQIALLQSGSIFGDKEAFLSLPQRMESIICNSETGKILCIHLNSLQQRLQANNEIYLLKELKQFSEIKEISRTKRIQTAKRYGTPIKSNSFVGESLNKKIDDIIHYKKKIFKKLHNNIADQLFIFDVNLPQSMTPGNQILSGIYGRRKSADKTQLNSRFTKRISLDFTPQCRSVVIKRNSLI